jgi:MFS transporter, DHA3 family, macrolide efflux protein
LDDRPAVQRWPLRRNRNFHITFWAQACTDYCDQFLVVALTWGALHRLGGADLGLVLASWALPRGALLLLSGVFVDRWDRRAVAVAVSIGLACLSLAAAAVSGLHEVLAWMAVAAAIGVLDAFRLPVGASVLPMVVPQEHLVSANRWAGVREWSALTGGPALGGVLVATAGVAGTFAVTAFVYGASFVLMTFAPPLRPRDDDEPTRVLADLKSGFKLVAGHRRLRVLLPTFAVTNLFVIGLIGVAIPVFVKEVLHEGPASLGFLSASFGAGLMAGTIGCNKLPAIWRDSQVRVFMLFALSDLMLALVGLAPDVGVACALYFLSGLAAGPPATFYRTLLQTLPPPEFLGRVNALARATSFGLEPVSTTAIGAITARISAAIVLLAGGGAALCTDLAGMWLSRGAAARVPGTGDAHGAPLVRQETAQ